MKTIAEKQATNALLAGALTCVATGLFAFWSDLLPLGNLAFDAFKMAFGLTIVVPPSILLVGRLITHKRN